MANEILSKNVLFKIWDTVSGAYKTIGRSTGYSLEVNKETVEVTSFDSAGWREFLVDLKDWAISADGVVLRATESGTENYEQILTRLIGSDATMIIQVANPAMYTDATDGSLYAHEVGAFHLTGLPLTGSLGDKQTYSLSGTGTGALTLVLAKYDTEAEAYSAEASYSLGQVIFVEDNVSTSVNGYYSRSSDGTPASFAAAWTAFSIG